MASDKDINSLCDKVDEIRSYVNNQDKFQSAVENRFREHWRAIQSQTKDIEKINDKYDKIYQAFIRIDYAEERIKTLDRDLRSFIETYAEDIKTVNNALSTIKNKVSSNGFISDAISKIGYIVFGVILTALVSVMFSRL